MQSTSQAGVELLCAAYHAVASARHAAPKDVGWSQCKGQCCRVVARQLAKGMQSALAQVHAVEGVEQEVG